MSEKLSEKERRAKVIKEKNEMEGYEGQCMFPQSDSLVNR